APWGFYVFITDGELHDLDEVKQYSRQLAREVAAGKRRPLKFVLIGVGRDVNERQMEELEHLAPGTPVDLGDDKLASELRQLQQIFAEVVDVNARVADRGKILDPQGRTVRDYSDTGLPAKLEFEIDAAAAYFTLDAAGSRIHQGLSDTAAVPASQVAAAPASCDEAPLAEPAEEVPMVELAQPPAAKPAPPAKGPAKQEPAKTADDDLFLDFKLEFEKDPAEGIDLRPDDDKK